ncbi:hypothetical protein [Luteimonas sp. MC1895]|uniref:hypothetical protein n=1 Tax=Luteimonas sp. MC1895 TaxID=2819513 RepID=UPI0018F06054|nr:hypothetical protein [Luteimonas sp. MC1895]MBJ6979795.1 hypothetical protein [Luteimonas sp. MC1895]
MPPRLLPLLLFAALAAPVQAQSPQPVEPTAAELQQAQARSDAWQAYASRAAHALARSDGARERALAVVLEALARPADEDGVARASPTAATWRETASTRGAGDRITQQLLVAAGIAAGDPDAAGVAARRWQALEPGNLAPLLFQGLGADATLAAAARSGRQASDPLALQRWVATAMRPHAPSAAEWAAFGEGPRPSAGTGAALTAGAVQGLLVPDYREVLGACTGRQLGAPGRAQGCRHLSALLLSDPQTLHDERIGLSLARALSRSAAERAPLDARRRGVDWRDEQMADLAAREGAASAGVHARLLADTSITTEDALVRRILLDAGVAPLPPADWRAPWEQPAR